MPVPGPRTQGGPLEGYRNPHGETPDRFHGRPAVPLMIAGRSPGTMQRNLRGNVLGAGQVRMLWRQAVNYLAAAEPFGWTTNGGDFSSSRPFGVTRALRYLTRSFYAGAGEDNTRLNELHTVVIPRVRSKAVTTPAGAKRSGPTVRNRLTSFGSRVTPINQASGSAQGDGQ